MKELYIQSHEELVNEYLEDHPNASWSQAYEATGDDAFIRARSKLESMMDMMEERDDE